MSENINKKLQYGALLLPIVLMYLMYWPIIDSWWLNDDTSILFQIIKNGTFAHIHVPNVELGKIPANHTPFLYLSFGLDYWLAGLSPTFAYVHHLIALSILVLMSQYFLSRLTNTLWGTIFTTLFVSGPVFSVLAQLLTTRHYVEGLTFALLSVLIYQYSLSNNRPIYAYMAMIPYLIACGYKEVYVTLPAIFTGLLLADSRYRISRPTVFKFLPVLASSIIYILWRINALGFDRVFRGYGSQQGQATAQDLINFPLRFWDSQGWSGNPIVFFSSGVLCLLVLMFFWDNSRRRLNDFTLAFMAFITIIVPILPVIHNFQVNQNYVFVWYFSLCCAFAVGAHAFEARPFFKKRRNARVVFSALTILFTTILVMHNIYKIKHSWLWGNNRRIVKKIEAEGLYLMHSEDSNKYIFRPTGAAWHFNAIDNIRQALGKEPSVGPCQTACECLELFEQNNTILYYHDKQQQLKPFHRIELERLCDRS